jgi:hypothetical protein
VFKGHPTYNTPKLPSGVYPVETLKYQEGTHTIPFYERPLSAYHCYIKSHIVYIPNWLVRLMLSLY